MDGQLQLHILPMSKTRQSHEKAVGQQEECPWTTCLTVALPFASWSHILLGCHILSWKPQTQEPPPKLGLAQAPTHLGPNPGIQGYGAAEGASLGCGHHVATEEEAEAHVTLRARGQHAHTAALGCVALDEFHGVGVRPQIQMAALQLEHMLRDRSPFSGTQP